MSTMLSDRPTVRLPQCGAATSRVVGIDLARGLAVIGMFAVHALPANWVHGLVAGRAAVLFAVLAGVSLVLISNQRGRSSQAPASVRIAVRAVLLFVLGLALTSLNVPPMVILQSYGVLFLLSVPVLRLRASVLAGLAGVFAVVAPILSFVIRAQGAETKVFGYMPDFGDFTSWSGMETVLRSVLLTGAYPVLTWFPFVLAGMALGKLDLRAVRGRLVAFGAGLAVVGYGISWLAMDVFGGFDRLIAPLRGKIPDNMLSLVLQVNYGTAPANDPVILFSAGAHSGTPFEIIGSTGVAVAVLGVCLYAARWSRVLVPLTSVGALPLTSYVGHCLLLLAFESASLKAALAGHPALPWLVLVVVTMVFCTVWSRLVGRGPLEWLMHRLSTLGFRRPAVSAGSGRAAADRAGVS